MGGALKNKKFRQGSELSFASLSRCCCASITINMRKNIQSKSINIMTTNEKPIYKIREFLKPTWKKQILFLISYFYLGGILFHLFVEGKFLGIAYQFLVFFYSILFPV